MARLLRTKIKNKNKNELIMFMKEKYLHCVSEIINQITQQWSWVSSTQEINRELNYLTKQHNSHPKYSKDIKYQNAKGM